MHTLGLSAIGKRLTWIKPIFFSAITLLLFSLTYQYVIPTSSLYPLRVLLGLLALCGIPGYYLSLILYSNSSGLMERFGISLIFGLALQIFNIIVLWSFLDALPVGLMENLSVMTLFIIIILALLLKESANKFIDKHITGVEAVLLIVFALAMSLRLWYQSFNENYITPDGAYYCDFARNLVANGEFLLKSITHYDPLIIAYDKNGLIGHPFVPFFLALFFCIGGINYFSAKMALVFAGSLIVFPIYIIAKNLFNERVGLIAAFFSALHPLLIFFSSILFGNEMVNNLFFLSTICFVILSFKETDNLRCPFLTGLFLYLTRGMWNYNADFFLFAMPLLLTFILKEDRGKIFILGILVLGSLSIALFLGPRSEYWLPIISALILVLGLMHFKSKSSNVRIFSSIILFYMLFINFGLIRLYRHYELFSIIAGPSVTTGSSMLMKAVSYVPLLYDRAHLWFDMVNRYVTSALFVLSIASILIFYRLRDHIIMLVCPLIYSAFFILFYINYPFYEERFFIPLIPFFSILSASAIEFLSSFHHIPVSVVFKIKRVLQKTFRLNKLISFTLTFIVLLSIFYLYYYDQYSQGITKMATINPVKVLHMKPTVQWIAENTSSNITLMNPNPTFYSWFTDRRCVTARNLNITLFYKVIHDFKVDYYIYDPDAKNWLPEVNGFIVRNWREPLPGLTPVFYQQYSSDVPEVIVYDVKDAQNLSLKERRLNITNCDTIMGWNVGTFYHADRLILLVDYTEVVEGEGSIVGRSVQVPTDSDIYLVYNLSQPFNLTHANYLHLWVKTNGLRDEANVWQIEIILFDSKGKWGSWRFNKWNDGKWQELYLPIGSYDLVSPAGCPDDMAQLMVRISNRDRSRDLALLVDDIYIVLYQCIG